jgi:F-type H+-transporting ATPase subunit gamma
MALKQIKNKISATKKIGQVTKAMGAVSAVKMRKSQERALSSRAYAHAAARILEHLSGTEEQALSPYTKPRTEGKTLLVMITSDKGLAGSANSAVLKQAESCIAAETCDALCVGRKAVEFARRELGDRVVAEYTNLADNITLAEVDDIAMRITSLFSKDAYKEVRIIYQNFISTFEQRPISAKLLPLDPEVLGSIVKGIRPAHGRYADDETFMFAGGNYSYEPGPEPVIEMLVPQLLTVMIFHALLESKASEHSARMVAMRNATDKAKEMVHDLTRKFNRERQAVITREVSEITGGIEAMRSSE